MSLELIDDPKLLAQLQFGRLLTLEDIASLVEVRPKQLIYYVFVAPPEKTYKYFVIPKKSGGDRVISAPTLPLKTIQQKLNTVLQNIYTAKPSVHGYVNEKSILTNARVHAKRKIILNLDLEDFFPSINFGRVRGMFMGFPSE